MRIPLDELGPPIARDHNAEHLQNWAADLPLVLHNGQLADGAFIPSAAKALNFLSVVQIKSANWAAFTHAMKDRDAIESRDPTRKRGERIAGVAFNFRA
jgi:hypothetical protein